MSSQASKKLSLTVLEGIQVNPNIFRHVPKVSVIVPAFNTAHLIGAALDSVFAQSFQDVEIIVVNDGSPDTADLERVLAPYVDKIIYIKQENKRAAGARNTAIRNARGEFLAFLDSDSTWLPGHLAAQVKLFEQNPELGLVYSDSFLWRDPHLQDTFMELCPSHGSVTFSSLVTERCQIPISTVVARKAIILKAGLFDESLLQCDDYDMWLRAAFHGARIGYTREVQVRGNRGRPGCLSASSTKMIEAYWKILEKADRELPLSDRERTCVRERSAEIRARYLLEQAKLELDDEHFGRAKKLFAEANVQLRRPLVGLVRLCLSIAPRTARRAVSLVRRVRRYPVIRGLRRRLTAIRGPDERVAPEKDCAA
jgi:glycosyltransferase involved in cell wall biosynthesis